MFARNLYRYGLLGRFIGILHAVARLNGKRLKDILSARDAREQRAIFEQTIAPLFDNRFVRFLSRMPVSYYGLGIPPAQYDELVASATDGDPITTLRAADRKIGVRFPGRGQLFRLASVQPRATTQSIAMAVPPYLRAENYETIRSCVDRVEVHHASVTDFLSNQPARSLHRFVLLDAQDWMNAHQMTSLWSQIDRTAAEDDARVIFRTAGADFPLTRKLPETLTARLELPGRRKP